MLWTVLAAAMLAAQPNTPADMPPPGADTPDAAVDAGTPGASPGDPTEAGTITRVGGDRDIEVTERPGPEGALYRAEGVSTDTKLPVGYPRPTPPGALEIKHYQTVRQAEVSGDGSPNSASMRGFWPLFRHISRNDIAMTAPVEMRYEDRDGDDRMDRWTMAFLYHVPENGPTGEDGSIVILDTEPVTVLSYGIRGESRRAAMMRYRERLMEWIEESDEWEVAGDFRALGYNGPNVRPANRWWEVQLPIRPKGTGDEAEAIRPGAPNDTD